MAVGPCLCGDIYCSSCGPAQGNFQCHICGKWSMDDGCDDVEECAKLGREMEKEIAEAWENDDE